MEFEPLSGTALDKFICNKVTYRAVRIPFYTEQELKQIVYRWSSSMINATSTYSTVQVLRSVGTSGSLLFSPLLHKMIPVCSSSLHRINHTFLTCSSEVLVEWNPYPSRLDRHTENGAPTNSTGKAGVEIRNLSLVQVSCSV